jgi:hypothetical protein
MNLSGKNVILVLVIMVAMAMFCSCEKKAAPVEVTSEYVDALINFGIIKSENDLSNMNISADDTEILKMVLNYNIDGNDDNVDINSLISKIKDTNLRKRLIILTSALE